MLIKVKKKGACYSNSEAGMCQSCGKVERILASVWCRRESKDRSCAGLFNTVTSRQCHRFIADCEQLHTVATLQIATNEGRRWQHVTPKRLKKHLLHDVNPPPPPPVSKTNNFTKNNCDNLKTSTC